MANKNDQLFLKTSINIDLFEIKFSKKFGGNFKSCIFAPQNRKECIFRIIYWAMV